MTGFIIRIAIAALSLGFNVWLFATGHWGWGITFLLVTAIIILSFFRNENMILALNQMRVGKTDKAKKYMILDNVRFHHAKILKPFLQKHKDKLELMFLPAYSPDLNPIERVWWYMRKKITHNRYIKTMKERMAAFWKMFSHFQKPNEEIIQVCNINFSV